MWSEGVAHNRIKYRWKVGWPGNDQPTVCPFIFKVMWNQILSMEDQIIGIKFTGLSRNNKSSELIFYCKNYNLTILQNFCNKVKWMFSRIKFLTLSSYQVFSIKFWVCFKQNKITWLVELSHVHRKIFKYKFPVGKTRNLRIMIESKI